MNTKEEVMETIVENIPGSFIAGEKNNEIRVPLENGKEVKLVCTMALKALGSPVKRTDEPSDEEKDLLAQLLQTLRV